MNETVSQQQSSMAIHFRPAQVPATNNLSQVCFWPPWKALLHCSLQKDLLVDFQQLHYQLQNWNQLAVLHVVLCQLSDEGSRCIRLWWWTICGSKINNIYRNSIKSTFVRAWICHQTFWQASLLWVFKLQSVGRLVLRLHKTPWMLMIGKSLCSFPYRSGGLQECLRYYCLLRLSL